LVSIDAYQLIQCTCKAELKFYGPFSVLTPFSFAQYRCQR